jgi:hypothetical protein
MEKIKEKIREIKKQLDELEVLAASQPPGPGQPPTDPPDDDEED